MTSSDESILMLDESNDKVCKRTTRRAKRIRSTVKAPSPKNYTKTWTDFEKQILLNLLYEHGDSDLEKLSEGLPNKHAEQIKTYLRTISRRAQLSEMRREKNQVIKNVDSWSKLLEDVYENGALADDSLPYHLFALSKEYRKHDTELTNEFVDFQKAYEYLYALTIGRKIDVDVRTYYFVHSYIEWFLTEFEKSVAQYDEQCITSGLRKVSDSRSRSATMQERVNEFLKLLFKKPMPHEFTLNYRGMLRCVCSRTKRTAFKKGDEYDRKIELLRAELGFEPPRYDCCVPTELVPKSNNFVFNNLPTFVWAALFNYSIGDLNKLTNQT